MKFRITTSIAAAALVTGLLYVFVFPMDGRMAGLGDSSQEPGGAIPESVTPVMAEAAPADPVSGSPDQKARVRQSLQLQIMTAESGPVPGAEVEVVFCDSSSRALFISDEDGEVQLPGTSSGRALVVANGVDGSSRVSGAKVLWFHQGLPAHPFLVSPMHTAVAGVVLQGTRPVVEQVVRGFKVPDARTDSCGFFILDDFPPGRLAVVVGARENALNRQRFSIERGQTILALIELPTASVHISVESADLARFPESDIPVTLLQLPLSAGGVRRQSVTTVSGDTSFAAVSPGKYLVSIGGFIPSRKSARERSDWAPKSKIIQVEEGDSSLHFLLQESSILRFKVFEPAFETQTRARVFLQIPGSGLLNDARNPFLSSRKGWSILALPPGESVVVFTEDLKSWGELAVNLAPGEELEAEIMLSTAYPSLTISVLGDGASKIDGLEIFDSRGNLVWSQHGRISNASFMDSDGSMMESSSRTQDGSDRIEPGYQQYIPALPVGVYEVRCFIDPELIASGSIGLVTDSEMTLYSQRRKED